MSDTESWDMGEVEDKGELEGMMKDVAARLEKSRLLDEAQVDEILRFVMSRALAKCK